MKKFEPLIIADGNDLSIYLLFTGQETKYYPHRQGNEEVGRALVR